MSSKEDTPPQGSRVFRPDYVAKTTKQIEAPDAFGAIQDLKAQLKRRWELEDKRQAETDARLSELERAHGQISQSDLSQQKVLADALIRIHKLETLPAQTAEVVKSENAKQTLDLKSSKLTEYLRLLGVVIGTALASYFASYRGSSEGQKPTIVNVQPATPGIGSTNGLESTQ